MSAPFFEIEKWQQLIYLLFSIILWFWISRKASFNIYSASIVNLPFTALHELAHLAVSTIMIGSKPTSFSLIPKKQGDSYVLGEVAVSNLTRFNAFPIAMAPFLLILIPLEFYPVWLEIFGSSVISMMSLSFFAAAIVNSATPSKQDFRIALTFPLFFLIYSSIIVIAVLFL